MRVWRVRSKEEQRVSPYDVFMWILIWITACFLVFTIRFWRLNESASPCTPCGDCYCSSAEFPLDCGKDDPATNEEINKDLLTMLSEELSLHTSVANETLEHTKSLVMDARNTFSRYKREVEKCNIGIETCEKARERAEADLIEERRLTTIWENRAREYGWKDRRRTRFRISLSLH